MIKACLSQHFVVQKYALFLSIFLCSKSNTTIFLLSGCLTTINMWLLLCPILLHSGVVEAFPCNPHQFACNSAFCIAMEKRCDAKEDCADGSDEKDCGKLIRRQGYKKELTPLPESGLNVSVNFSFNIHDILQVNEHSNTFSVKESHTRTWFDSRLMYKHLKKDSGMKMNTLLDEESESIWFPYVVFNNIRNIEDVKKTDVPDIHEVIPNDDFAYEAKDNMHIFKGSENALSLTKERNVEWTCDYIHHWYPFDTQVCRMEFFSLRDRTDLHPTLLQYNPSISLERYFISRIRMCKSTIHNMNAIIVEVILGRPIISNLITVFVPTALLLLISFTARFFAEDYIDMVIQVNLTILLVLATM